MKVTIQEFVRESKSSKWVLKKSNTTVQSFDYWREFTSNRTCGFFEDLGGQEFHKKEYTEWGYITVDI